MSHSTATIYDWNQHETKTIKRPVLLNDETLRDGLQSPSTIDPPLENKIELLRIMEELGINAADIGYPSASKKMYEDVTALARLIKEDGFKISPNCAARTHPYDIEPIIDISLALDIPIEVCTFLGTSPIRQLIERWDTQKLEELARSAIRLCVDNDMPVMFVTEDTTRATPDDIKKIYLAAVEEGANAICIADTVGHATPKGAFSVVKYVREFLHDEGYDEVRIDWHGHRDRGLSVANAIAANEAGAVRIHGTALGIGERCGNAPMDQLLVNFKMLGYIDQNLSHLPAYASKVSQMVGMPIPVNYPVLGKDAFRTATGVHAAAILKAKELGMSWMNSVYSSVPADAFGMVQQIDIGPMSGMSNVWYKLDSMDVKASKEQATKLLEYAKSMGRILSEDEIREYLSQEAMAMSH